MTPEGKLKAAEARRRFGRMAALPDASIDLAHAALLVAAEEQPDVDVEHYRARLFELGLAARAYVAARSWEPVEALNEFVFSELGFVGNQASYYDPRNSLLPYVIEQRRGIPITLSIVYMELGRRAGLEVEGVGLPGHFVVRVALTEEHLRASTNREILARVLRNLKAVHAQSRRHRRALAAVERVQLLDPEAHDERRDRGLLLAQLGRYTEAIAELKAYLSRTVPDEEQVREQLKKVWVQLSMLN
jgi:regulator of sirC expression with transglutaminase-like and TPR domain